MTDETNSLSLEYYVVGFFDLLGQQEHLRNLQQLPNKSDVDALAKTRDDLKNTYGAVSGMRKWFADAFQTYTRKSLASDSLTPEQTTMYLQMNNNPIQFQGFSDSMVVFLSLHDTVAAKVHPRGVLGIFSAAALTFIGSLGVGHPIRGGIDVGIGYQPNTGEIYGPALSRAYMLESKIANYPRIIVGDELIRYLTETRNQSATDAFATQSKSVAAECMNCLAYDDDGIPFVDYIGPYFREVLGTSDGAKFVDMAYDHVIKFSNRFKEEKNSQLAFRYALLRNYFEARLPLWADLPRNAETEN
jgi:hypothetical protein